MGVVAGSPLSMGLLSPQGPPDWHPAPSEVKDACEAVRTLCKERDVSLPKIALHTAFQYVQHIPHVCPPVMSRNPDIATTLVGMPTVNEVRENVATAQSPSLTDKESKCLSEVLEMLSPVHNRTWPSGRPENN